VQCWRTYHYYYLELYQHGSSLDIFGQLSRSLWKTMFLEDCESKVDRCDWPVMKNVAEALYWSKRSKIWLV
jgi:hypothetical protein